MQPSRAEVDDNMLGVLCALVFACVAAVQAPTASVPQRGGVLCHVCDAYLHVRRLRAAFKSGGGTGVPPPRPSSSAWAALRVMNNDRAQRYGATSNRPDRHLTPSSLASPSDPSLTCAVPCAAGCCPVKSAKGMLPPRAHRVAVAQQVSAFTCSIRTQ